MKSLQIHSSSFDYPVHFSDNLKKTLQALNKNNKLHLLIDKNIWNLYKKEIGKDTQYASLKLFDATENNKNLDEVSSYITFLLENKIHKDHKIVVIGGGLVQDIGSFTAHILLRGVGWIFVPTTLLSMADSCIGSKSGINVGKYKNQIGAFNPPSEIYIITSFIQSLSAIDLANGIGEIVKHAFIKGGEAYDYITTHLAQMGKDDEITTQIIYKSLLIKKEIIEKDEFEKNIRKILNYGHTFGHALEGYTGNKIPHGVGVLIGVGMANYISLKKKILSQSEYDKMHKLISTYATHAVEITDYDRYMDFLSRDKKVIGDEVQAILSRGIGKIEVVRTKLDGALKEMIRDYFEKEE